MGPKKRQSVEERRKQKRECEKRRREKIRNDPVKCQLQKQKDHERYEKNKERGVIKLVNDLSRREKKTKRKKWVENQKNHRNKIKALKAATNETPPSSDDEDNLIEGRPGTPKETIESEANSQPKPYSNSCISGSGSSRQKSRGRTLVRRDRAKCYKSLQKIEHENKKLKRKIQVWKKRYYRLEDKKKARTVIEPSPNTKVQEMIKGYDVPSSVKKKLLFGEVLRNELSVNFKNLNTQSSKQVFAKAINGRLLKKYRLLKEAKSFLPNKLFNSNKKRSEALKYDRKSMQHLCKIKKIIMDYYTNDNNSRVCPGKKDTLTKKGIKKQKRYLNDNMKNLFINFHKTHNIKISYSTFCKLRPFWVVPPKVSSRDTCLCITHENFKMIISCLHRLKVIKENSSQEVLTTLCCDSRAENCLKRDCDACKCNKVLFTVNDEMWGKCHGYQRWETKKELRISAKTKKEITVQITFKNKIMDFVENIITIFNCSVPKFLGHTLNITHQYVAITELKNNLKENELLLHIDFSENFSCKYASEAQAVHFGASRDQITLHTGMMYYRSEKQGFCSISASLRHDPCAVAAHLKPILTHYLNKFGSKITTLHVLSDSPSTQYRNRKIFYLLAKYIPEHFPTISKISWNYSESGHGKGAPDGIGATIKRFSDQAVACNKDVNSFETFVKLIKESNLQVYIDFVTPDEITDVENYLPKNVPFCKGVMKVHQATWDKNTDMMYFNTLSCFHCELGTSCSHYGLCSLSYDIKSNSASKMSPDIGATDLTFEVNDWIAAIFDNKWYPGKLVRRLI